MPTEKSEVIPQQIESIEASSRQKEMKEYAIFRAVLLEDLCVLVKALRDPKEKNEIVGKLCFLFDQLGLEEEKRELELELKVEGKNYIDTSDKLHSDAAVAIFHRQPEFEEVDDFIVAANEELSQIVNVKEKDYLSSMLCEIITRAGYLKKADELAQTIITASNLSADARLKIIAAFTENRFKEIEAQQGQLSRAEADTLLKDIKSTVEAIYDVDIRTELIKKFIIAEAQLGFFGYAKEDAMRMYGPISRIQGFIDIARLQLERDDKQANILGTINTATAGLSEVLDQDKRRILKQELIALKKEILTGKKVPRKDIRNFGKKDQSRAPALKEQQVKQRLSAEEVRCIYPLSIDDKGLSRLKKQAEQACAYAENGYIFEAESVAEQMQSEGSNHRTRAWKAIMTAYAKQGDLQSALRVAQKIDQFGGNTYSPRNEKNYELIGKTAAQMRQSLMVIQRLYHDSAQKLSKGDSATSDYQRFRLAKAELNVLFDYFSKNRQTYVTCAQTDPAQMIPAVLHNEQLFELVYSFLPQEKREVGIALVESDRDRKTAQQFGDLVMSRKTEIQGTDAEHVIRLRVRKNIHDFFRTVSQEPEAIVDTRKDYKIALRIIANLSPDIAKEELLHAARTAEGGMKNPLFARLLSALIHADSPKGQDFAVKIIGASNLPDSLAWFMLQKLIDVKYLDRNLLVYLKKERASVFEGSSVTNEDLKRQDLELVRLIINRLSINPDSDIVRLIREEPWYDERSNRIDPRENPETIIDRIDQRIVEFKQIKERDELVRTLISDKNKAASYYMIHGGNVHFSLVNSYNFEKFFTILNVVSTLEYHPLPAITFNNALESQGFSQKEARELGTRLHDGVFPFPGESAWRVRLDVSESEELDVLEEEIRSLFGKTQLGSLIKYIAYFQMLEGDPQMLARLEGAQGLADLESIFQEIEALYPTFQKMAEEKFEKPWKKIGEKGVLNISLTAVMNEDGNEVNIIKAARNLDQHRKVLAQSVRQQYKSQSIDKLVRDERLQVIEGKSHGKLMRYMVESTLGGEALPEKARKLFEEWETHLQGVFIKLDELRSCIDIREEATNSKTVTLRYLNKAEDLIPGLRFADSAQCCFTSTQYRIEGHQVGNAEWIARIWKDPLSFVFLIEDNPIGAQKREAIGFVFGSFGLNEAQQPVVLLNGVYMQSLKTDRAAQAIINAIERRFSKPLKMTEQFIAARHAGKANYGPGYNNNPQRIHRLRALKGRSGNPEDKIYDDLSLMPNQIGTTDSSIWHKQIQ